MAQSCALGKGQNVEDAVRGISALSGELFLWLLENSRHRDITAISNFQNALRSASRVVSHVRDLVRVGELTREREVHAYVNSQLGVLKIMLDINISELNRVSAEISDLDMRTKARSAATYTNSTLGALTACETAR